MDWVLGVEARQLDDDQTKNLSRRWAAIALQRKSVRTCLKFTERIAARPDLSRWKIGSKKRRYHSHGKNGKDCFRRSEGVEVDDVGVGAVVRRHRSCEGSRFVQGDLHEVDERRHDCCERKADREVEIRCDGAVPNAQIHAQQFQRRVSELHRLQSGSRQQAGDRVHLQRREEGLHHPLRRVREVSDHGGVIA